MIYTKTEAMLVIETIVSSHFHLHHMLKASSQHPTKDNKLPLKQEPLDLIVNLQTKHTVVNSTLTLW